MTSPDNILLHLRAEEEAYVRSIFDELARRGFPRQQQTPHITITFAPTMPAAPVECAAQRLPGLIPAEFARVGTVVFGTKSKQTIAWLLESDEALEQAAREISACNPEGRGGRWIPHLTMGLRIPRAQVGAYIQVLDEVTSPHRKTLTATRAALWRPSTKELKVLAGS